MISHKHYIIGLVLSATLCLTCIILTATYSYINKSSLVRKTQLTPTNKEYFDNWINSKFKTSIEVYFFNLTNPEQFRLGFKPILSQIGPYTYNVYDQKVHVAYNSKRGEISFETNRQFHFSSHLSCPHCTENDSITQVNPVLVHVANYYFHDSKNSRIASALFDAGTLIKQFKVIDLIRGYEDDTLKVFTKNSHVMGLFGQRTNGHKMVASDGLHNVHSKGSVVKYMNEHLMNVWKSNYANIVCGTDGKLFHPMIEKNEDLYVFMPDMCLSATYQFKYEFKLDGLTVNRYNLNPHTFSSANKFEMNKGFCLDYPNCFKDGLLDMSTCIVNSSIVMSQPHFNQADEEYQKSILGLHPSNEVESTYVVEPQTGSVLESDEKFQVNLMVVQNPYFLELQYVTSLVLPLMHFNKTFIAPIEFKKQLLHDIYNAPRTMRTLLNFLSIFSLSIFIIIGSFYYKHYVRKHQKGYAETVDKVDDTQSIVKM